MNLRNALLAAAVVAAPVLAASAVQAQALNGLYVGAGAGINWMTETGVNPGGAKVTSDGVGFVGLGSIGYAFGNGVRVELEGNYRHQPVKIGGFRGHGNSYGPMVNALFDMDAGMGFTPYIGAGVGYQWGDMNIGGRATGKGAWAAQGILGAAFPIAEVPGLAVTAEARVLGTLEKVRYGSAGGSTDPQLHVSGLLGLRYAFGIVAPAAMAAPAAVPAPAPARTYLVFFDWDKSNLTPRAQQIIADAAQASTRVATTRIEVGGHADRTGTAQYNQALSMRRAQAVAAELVRLGVARNAIDINAFGDTRPLVATAANTREPQNRRVEIVLK